MGRVVSRNRGAPVPQRAGPAEPVSPGLLPEHHLPCILDKRLRALCRRRSPMSRGSNHQLRLARDVRPGWSLSLLKKILKPKMPLTKVSFLFQRMSSLGRGESG